ncbi:restriction endonuclease subunit S, partial [Flavobacterium psychrophilum]
VAELSAHLKVTGLNNYILTNEEQKVLEDFENGKLKWKEFNIGSLFDIDSYKKRFDANKVIISETGKPYVVRTSLNNGIRGFINEDEQYLNDGNTISFGQDTATMFYQEQPYFTGDKIKIVKSKDKKFNKLNAQFFIATMTKSFSSFSWGSSSYNIKIIGNQQIQLPIHNDKPNYELIETFITAIQKLVIKEVVLYADRKIEATKLVTQN